MPYPFTALDFGNPFEDSPQMTEKEAAEFESRLKVLQGEHNIELEYQRMIWEAGRARNKFDSALFLMQCDWDELVFYKKWYFHICKFFGVWYDWNKGKYLG